MSESNPCGGNGGEGGGGNETTECTGCVLVTSLNGGPATPVQGGSAAIPFNLTQALDPLQSLATLMFTFDAEAGECDPNANCAPKKPCKVKNPAVAITAPPGGTGLTVKTTVSIGPISPPSSMLWIPSGTIDIINLRHPTGTGAGTSDDPHVIPMNCGSAPLVIVIRIECYDPSLGQTNGQEIKLIVTCTACQSAH